MFNLIFLVAIGILIGLFIRVLISHRSTTVASDETQAAKSDVITQIQRWIQLMELITSTETAVYNNTVPKGTHLQNLAFKVAGTASTTIKCHCRGVEVRWSVDRSSATVRWVGDNCFQHEYWQQVFVDLTKEISADKIAELMVFFRKKKNATDLRNHC